MAARRAALLIYHSLLIFCTLFFIPFVLFLLHVHTDTFETSQLAGFLLTWFAYYCFPNCFPLHLPSFRPFVISSFSFFMFLLGTVSFLLCYFQMLPALSTPPTHPFIFKLTATVFVSHHCIHSRPPQQFLKDILHPAYLCMELILLNVLNALL